MYLEIHTVTQCNNDIKKRRIKKAELILCCFQNQIIHLVVAHAQKFTSLCKLFISIPLGLFLIRILHFNNGICGDEIFYHFCSQSSIRPTVNISRCSCTMDKKKLDTDVQNISSVGQKHKLQPQMETGRLERQFFFPVHLRCHPPLFPSKRKSLKKNPNNVAFYLFN